MGGEGGRTERTKEGVREDREKKGGNEGLTAPSKVNEWGRGREERRETGREERSEAGRERDLRGKHSGPCVGELLVGEAAAGWESG